MYLALCPPVLLWRWGRLQEPADGVSCTRVPPSVLSLLVLLQVILGGAGVATQVAGEAMRLIPRVLREAALTTRGTVAVPRLQVAFGFVPTPAWELFIHEN